MWRWIPVLERAILACEGIYVRAPELHCTRKTYDATLQYARLEAVRSGRPPPSAAPIAAPHDQPGQRRPAWSLEHDHLYWWHDGTREVRWDPPTPLAAAQGQWRPALSLEHHRQYWWHEATREVSWDPPAPLAAVAAAAAAASSRGVRSNRGQAFSVRSQRGRKQLDKCLLYDRSARFG